MLFYRDPDSHLAIDETEVSQSSASFSCVMPCKSLNSLILPPIELPIEPPLQNFSKKPYFAPLRKTQKRFTYLTGSDIMRKR